MLLAKGSHINVKNKVSLWNSSCHSDSVLRVTGTKHIFHESSRNSQNLGITRAHNVLLTMQDGKTPLDVAKETDHSAVVELLSSDTQV